MKPKVEHKIQLIVQDDCPNCEQYKYILDINNIHYDRINVNTLSKEELDNYINQGVTTTPILTMDDKIVTLADIIDDMGV
jgi:glutaredoxin